MKRFNGEEFVDLYEERLYSTGSDELDELLEKAFCEGYEYAQREFGEEEDEEEKVMKGIDKFNLWQYKHLYGKRGRKAEQDRIDFGKEEDAGATKRTYKRTLSGAVAFPVLTTAAGAVLGKGTGDAKHGAKIGALLGGAASIGTVAGTALGHASKKALLQNEKYAKSWDKQSDLLKVADGKMSEEDFIDKWGKKKK